MRTLSIKKQKFDIFEKSHSKLLSAGFHFPSHLTKAFREKKWGEKGQI